MPDEPEIDAEALIRALQVVNGDRLAALRIFQRFTTDVESALISLKQDIAEYNTAIEARNAPPPAVIPSDEDEEDSENDEDEDE
jgi:hypothetical protein